MVCKAAEVEVELTMADTPKIDSAMLATATAPSTATFISDSASSFKKGTCSTCSSTLVMTNTTARKGFTPKLKS